MQMDVGLDTGDMLYKLSCPITAEDTSGTLYDKLAELGPQGLITTLKQLADGTAKPEVQDETLVTYAEKLSKEEARIDWSLSAAQLERCIRAFNPWPMSWLEIEGQPVKVWKASVIDTATNAAPGTILLLYVHTNRAVLTNAVVRRGLSGSRRKNIPKTLDRHLTDNAMRSDPIDRLVSGASLIRANLGVGHQRTVAHENLLLSSSS